MNLLKQSFYFLCCLIILCCSCIARKLYINYPDKSLEEIILLGEYHPKDIQDETKRRQKKYENCRWYYKDHSQEYIDRQCEDELTKKENEITQEDSFNYSGINYCYNEVKDKYPVYDKKLVARLYDKQGKILAEDYPRCDRDLDGTANCDKQNSPGVTIYLPYNDKGHEMQIVNLKEKKEFIVYKRDVFTQSILTETDLSKIRHSYTYDKELQCFIAFPIR